jgi:hypothetical protein
MAAPAETPGDRLWKEYSLVFREFDDLSLARWVAQTLGQLAGKSWRLSHPLVRAYQLGAQAAHERQIWLKRLVNSPHGYSPAACCRAPMLPLLTRDVAEAGLVCLHCSETLVPFEEVPSLLRSEFQAWATQYAPVHAVAHWDDQERKRAGNYEQAFEKAAADAERLLAHAGEKLAPKLLDFYPAVVWEDHDECLEVRPEEVEL